MRRDESRQMSLGNVDACKTESRLKDKETMRDGRQELMMEDEEGRPIGWFGGLFKHWSLDGASSITDYGPVAAVPQNRRHLATEPRPGPDATRPVAERHQADTALVADEPRPLVPVPLANFTSRMWLVPPAYRVVIPTFFPYRSRTATSHQQSAPQTGSKSGGQPSLRPNLDFANGLAKPK